MEFKLGDVVCLKCGGPDMIVEKLRRGNAACVWFDRGHRLKERLFHLDLLRAGGEEKGVVNLTIVGLDHTDEPTSGSSSDSAA